MGKLRRLYSIYSALTREFSIEKEFCRELEETSQVPSAEAMGAEAIAEAEKWFAVMDQKMQIQHLRQFVQTSPLIHQGVLRALGADAEFEAKVTPVDSDADGAGPNTKSARHSRPETE